MDMAIWRGPPSASERIVNNCDYRRARMLTFAPGDAILIVVASQPGIPFDSGRQQSSSR